MAQVITNSGVTYGKSLSAGILTSVAWSLFCIIYDFFDLNDALFPFLKGFSLKKLITAAVIGFIIILGLAIFVAMPHDTRIPEQRFNG